MASEISSEKAPVDGLSNVKKTKIKRVYIVREEAMTKCVLFFLFFFCWWYNFEVCLSFVSIEVDHL